MRLTSISIFSVALALSVTLTACGGGGTSNAPTVSSPNAPGGGTPSPSPSPAPTGSSGAPQAAISVGGGETNGNPQPLLVSAASNNNGYSGSGDLMPGQTGATASGGGQGQSVDGATCQQSMPDNYHIHFFLGIYYNGQEVAVPAGVGMVNPVPPNQSVLNGNVVPSGTSGSIPNQSWQAQCFYDFHVHDNSGMIHVETASNGTCGAFANPPYSNACNYQAAGNGNPWTLQTFLDIWGISIGSNNFGPLSGPVQIYTTPPGYISYNNCAVNGNQFVIPPPCATNSSAYQLAPGNVSQIPSQIPIFSHTTIWILVGSNNPTGANLPSITWVEGNP